MKKTILFFFLSFSFLNAEVFWNDIYKYDSIKISEDKYQVKTINQSNFLENHLYLDAKNNNLIKNSKKCQYITTLKKKNDKTFSFIGDGSIQCNYTPIEFISKKLNISDEEMSRIILFDLLLTLIPYIMIIGAVVIFLIISIQTRKKRDFFIGIILAIIIFILSYLYGDNLHKEILNNMVYETVSDFEKCNKNDYYIDPKLIK